MDQRTGEGVRARLGARIAPLLALAAVFAVLVGVSALEANLAAGEAVVASRRHVVEIGGFEYRPAALRVNAGDTVVWVNRDVVPHTATADGRAWDTGNLAANASASVVVRGNGEQPYVCAYHPSMRGKLVVDEAAGAADVSRSKEES